jgi:signal transduction histidine kinase
MDLGRLKMDFEIMDSRAMLEDMLHYISLDWKDSHIEIIQELPFASEKVKVDMKRIAQVMDNIMQNASRYVGGNGEIRVSAVREGDELIISIKDNGIGIDKEDLPYIFDIFYRGEKSRSRNYGGSGLGLAICKSIIEDHGGRIWAESSPGQGTTISFSLPIIQNNGLE